MAKWKKVPDCGVPAWRREITLAEGVSLILWLEKTGTEYIGNAYIGDSETFLPCKPKGSLGDAKRTLEILAKAYFVAKLDEEIPWP